MKHTFYSTTVTVTIPLIAVAIIVLQVEPEKLIVDAIFMSEETHFYFVNEKLHPIIVTVTNQHH